MAIVIDGWNFIRDASSDIEDSESDSLVSARILIDRLKAFQSSHNDPIIVVFDSTNEFLGLDYRNSPNLSVVATRDADEYIKRHLDKIPEKQRKNIRVVSSDNDVFYYTKSSYAMPVKCRDFWKKLKPGLH